MRIKQSTNNSLQVLYDASHRIKYNINVNMTKATSINGVMQMYGLSDPLTYVTLKSMFELGIIANLPPPSGVTLLRHAP